MKQTIQLEQAYERMKQGIITRDGFIGIRYRKLIDILIEDDEEV
jgi:hypothetical protein